MNTDLKTMVKARMKPKIITLTETAAERVRAIMSKSSENIVGVRVGVKNGGCAGMEYTMDYALEQDPLDDVVEDKGVKIHRSEGHHVSAWHGNGLQDRPAFFRFRV